MARFASVSILEVTEFVVWMSLSVARNADYNLIYLESWSFLSPLFQDKTKLGFYQAIALWIITSFILDLVYAGKF